MTRFDNISRVSNLLILRSIITPKAKEKKKSGGMPILTSPRNNSNGSDTRTKSESWKITSIINKIKPEYTTNKQHIHD